MNRKMHSQRMTRLGALAAALVTVDATAQAVRFTSQFPLDACHFSIFGGHPHFILNPGHQLVLRGEEEGVPVELAITPLNETRQITLPAGDRSRRILTRVVEERETVDGELAEISRYWYARCLETGDVYFFGEEVDIYEQGVLASSARLWEAGVAGALPGVIMPRTFLLGARYFQAQAPGFALDQAENIDMELTVQTPAGVFENCVQVKEYDGLRPENDPSVKTFAPGVGVVSDDGILELSELRLGTEGIAAPGSFVPFSSNPHFPFAPGWWFVLQGQTNGAAIVRTVTVLDETRQIRLTIAGDDKLIPTRAIEERETVEGELVRVARGWFAQCIETGDVYAFGAEVDHYRRGVLTGHDGTWLAGESDARPGLSMPGEFTVAAQYSPALAPGVAETLATNTAKGLTVTVPGGTFRGCATVTETDLLAPEPTPRNRTYAPGIGLIRDGESFELAAFGGPNLAAGTPVLSLEDTVLLTWPLSDTAFQVESSPDLEDWTLIPLRGPPVDGRNELVVPRDAARQYFRLASP